LASSAVVCANADDGAKIAVPAMISAAARLAVTNTATVIIVVDLLFTERRKRTTLIRVPPNATLNRFYDFVMMIASLRVIGLLLLVATCSRYALVRGVCQPDVRVDACAERCDVWRLDVKNNVRVL
jgi:hypothetical protein